MLRQQFVIFENLKPSNFWNLCFYRFPTGGSAPTLKTACFNFITLTFLTHSVVLFTQLECKRRQFQDVRQNQYVTEENWSLCKKDYIWLLTFLSEFWTFAELSFSNIFFFWKLNKNSEIFFFLKIPIRSHFFSQNSNICLRFLTSHRILRLKSVSGLLVLTVLFAR